MTRRRWLSALLLTAIGLYFSRGLLDIVGGSGSARATIVRVAMLPPWWELAAFALVLATVALALSRGNRDADVVLPLCALAILAVPYLPWLPDRLPLLRGPAGPARNLLWMVVFWLVCARAFSGLRITVPSRAPLAIFATSALVVGAVAWRLTSTLNYPSGDEPHYLVITQSLLKDRDLKIENNHRREDYRAYYNAPLKPHYLTRGKDRQIYSIHPVGVSVLAMPAFALGGYRGVVALLVLMAAAAATLLWRWAYESSRSASAATFAWAATALTAPFLFNSFTVYPEIPGALAMMVALAWRADSATTAMQVVRGIAIGSLPWLSTKYAVMAAAGALVLMFRAGWNIRALIALVSPMLVLLVGWFGFFYWIWGTVSPSAPYGASEPTTLGYLAHGGPGLFFDQEYGVVFYAPVLVLAFVGLVRMLRAGGSEARRGLEVTIVLGALVATVGAFHIWWGGSASPGRPVASGILLLGVPIASLFAATSSRPSARAICHVLLASSLALAVTLATTQDGSLLHNDRDGMATLLEWMSPTWPLTSVFPSYISTSLPGAVARTLGWLAVGALVAWIVRLVSPRQIGAASLATLILGFAGAVTFASATRPATAPATIEPEARARVPLLDEFDSQRRPIIVVYDPFSSTSAADLMSRAVLIARPGQRSLPQPVELLWNARFALPAGEYRLALERLADTAQSESMLGLQIGRVGAPLERWRVAEPLWEQTVVLPIDTALVGLRPLSTNVPSGGELRVTPIHVVDESRRVERPPILSATHYGLFTAFFHDDTTLGEPAGYWTHGGGTTRITYVKSSTAPASIDVDVRCGPIANRVTIAMPGWSEQILVEPGGSHHLSIPTVVHPDLDLRLAPLDITVRDGFVPAEIDPASTDRRRLGCWVEHLSYSK